MATDKISVDRLPSDSLSRRRVKHARQSSSTGDTTARVVRRSGKLRQAPAVSPAQQVPITEAVSLLEAHYASAWSFRLQRPITVREYLADILDTLEINRFVSIVTTAPTSELPGGAPSSNGASSLEWVTLAYPAVRGSDEKTERMLPLVPRVAQAADASATS